MGVKRLLSNDYFQSLPDETKAALGKVAFDTYLHFDPPFAWTGKWEDVTPAMKTRWLAIVEAVMNALQVQEYVPSHMELFNQARRVLDESIERFEAIRPEDHSFNNYQWLETLRSANAEIINARLLMNRADIATGHIGTGDEDTANVRIPNVRTPE
jgi:hypothetical protein